MWASSRANASASASSGSASALIPAPSPRRATAEIPSLPGSYEKNFHATEVPRFWLNLRETNAATKLLRERRLQRAIGVIYRPETERGSHYFEACLPEQFDALIHFDETRALEPLERNSEWARGELPDTYPEGL